MSFRFVSVVPEPLVLNFTGGKMLAGGKQTQHRNRAVYRSLEMGTGAEALGKIGGDFTGQGSEKPLRANHLLFRVVIAAFPPKHKSHLKTQRQSL